MAKSSGIVYRNWATEYGTIDAGSTDSAGWEAGAPATNMLTPQSGQVAIHDGTAGEKVWRVNIGADSASSSNSVGRPVGCVALVNFNVILDPADVALARVHLIDSTGDSLTCNAPAVTLDGSGGAIQSLVWMVADDATGSGDLSSIVAIEFEIDGALTFGARDAWTGAESADAMKIGTVVAGPLWRPARGIKMSPFAPGVIDTSPVIKTIGDTVWASPQTRMRRVSGEFALLTEAEVEARPPLCGLRQMADHCGMSRPLLLIPSDTDAQYLAAQAIHGYLVEEVTWQLIDKSGGGTVKEFRSAFNLLESK